MGTIAFLVLISLAIFMGGFLFLLNKLNPAMKQSTRRTAPVRPRKRMPGKLESIKTRKNPRKDKNTETESLMKDFQDFHAGEIRKEELAKWEAEADKAAEKARQKAEAERLEISKARLSYYFDSERNHLDFQWKLWEFQRKLVLETEGPSKLLLFLREKEAEFLARKKEFFDDYFQNYNGHPESIHAFKKEISDLQNEHDQLIESVRKRIGELETNSGESS